jgi:hypothetical protein
MYACEKQFASNKQMLCYDKIMVRESGKRKKGSLVVGLLSCISISSVILVGTDDDLLLTFVVCKQSTEA